MGENAVFVTVARAAWCGCKCYHHHYFSTCCLLQVPLVYNPPFIRDLTCNQPNPLSVESARVEETFRKSEHTENPLTADAVQGGGTRHQGTSQRNPAISSKHPKNQPCDKTCSSKAPSTSYPTPPHTYLPPPARYPSLAPS